MEIWVEQTISGDLFVTTRMAEINRTWEPFPEGVEDYLQGLPTVALVPNRRFTLSYDGFPFQLEAMDFATFDRYGAFFWLEGDPRQLMEPLTAGEGVIVSEVFANRTGLSVGDRFRTQVQGLSLDWPILGIVRDYRTRGGVVFCSLEDLRRQWRDGLGRCPDFHERPQRRERSGRRSPAGRSPDAFRRPAGDDGRA